MSGNIGFRIQQGVVLDDTREITIIGYGNGAQLALQYSNYNQSATIKNIILNRRKLEFIKKFENDILLDAIKLKTFEVY